ncbi:MAG: metal ABC transporter ATP-binding protein [Pseudomonadota bacterium]
MSALVTIDGLSVRFGTETVLSHVDLKVEPGEIVTIVGPNGSGKTTLLRTVLGATAPTSGKVTARRGLRMGYVPQKLAMDSTLPITARRFLNLPKRVDDKKAARALERTGASALSERQLNDLSGGQLQRVLLARALTGEPELLLLDEPTQGLDQPGSADFYELIEDVRRDLGCGVLMVSHELHVVMAASDRVICLNGHVCCQGTPEHVASAPEYRALFGTGTKGALALYRHQHDHHHHDHEHS